MVPTLAVALALVAVIAAFAYWPSPPSAGPAPLEASVDINRTGGPHPLMVTVTANVTGGTPPYRYAWSFGDGGTSSAASVTHVFGQHGTFQVLLQVGDRANRTAAAGVTVKVKPIHEHSILLNASSQTLGAGMANAWIEPFSIPPTAESAWVNGTVNVTGCSLGGNCAAFVEILNADDETNLTRGGAITDPIWCLTFNGTCQSNQTTEVSADLGGVPGQTVYLVIYNTDLVWSQSVSARMSMTCWY